VLETYVFAAIEDAWLWLAATGRYAKLRLECEIMGARRLVVGIKRLTFLARMSWVERSCGPTVGGGAARSGACPRSRSRDQDAGTLTDPPPSMEPSCQAWLLDGHEHEID